MTSIPGAPDDVCTCGHPRYRHDPDLGMCAAVDTPVDRPPAIDDICTCDFFARRPDVAPSGSAPLLGVLHDLRRRRAPGQASIDVSRTELDELVSCEHRDRTPPDADGWTLCTACGAAVASDGQANGRPA